MMAEAVMPHNPRRKTSLKISFNKVGEKETGGLLRIHDVAICSYVSYIYIGYMYVYRITIT